MAFNVKTKVYVKDSHLEHLQLNDNCNLALYVLYIYFS